MRQNFANINQKRFRKKKFGKYKTRNYDKKRKYQQLK